MFLCIISLFHVKNFTSVTPYALRDAKSANLEILMWQFAKALRSELGSSEKIIRWHCVSYEKQCHLPAEICWKNIDLIAYQDSHFLKPLLRAHLIPEIQHTITCLVYYLTDIQQKYDRSYWKFICSKTVLPLQGIGTYSTSLEGSN